MSEPTQEQIQAMVDVWHEWSAQTPGLRPSVNTMMRRAYDAAMTVKDEQTYDRERDAYDATLDRRMGWGR